MNKELYVSTTPHETKVALVEDDQLAEVFFERENEYTLAGSIYKGRVTRVLPGMQSAFVDIGLERDAFLYVSDFLELGGEEEEEEFGNIPTGRGTVDFSKPFEAQEYTAEPAEAPVEPAAEADSDSDFEPVVEDFSPPSENEEEVEEAESASEGQADSEAQSDAAVEGARRWRGRRRRRGGRRGRSGDRFERSEQSPAHAEHSERDESPQDFGPPPGWTPIILPGESISKYRNITTPEPEAEGVDEHELVVGEHAQAAAEEGEHPVANGEREPQEIRNHDAETAAPEHAVAAPVEPGESSSAAHPASVAAAVAHEEVTEAKAEEHAIEEQKLESVPVPPAEEGGEPQAPVASTIAEASEAEPAQSESSAPGSFEAVSRESVSAAPDHDHDIFPQSPDVQAAEAQARNEAFENEPEGPEAAAAAEVNHVSGEAVSSYPQHPAPSFAPKGRTLEHEDLEDDESEYRPVPDDVSAMREYAADAEVDLEEETLDPEQESMAGRWIPQVADIDEEEVAAAAAFNEDAEGEYEEEEEEEEGEEETNGRAELRAATPTAGYQQRAVDRVPSFDRRRRGRRGGSRRNLRTRPNNQRSQPLITDLLKEGQEVLVQIAKEPIGKKGARITSHIALPGRFLVYMPTVNHIGVSRKISSDEERQRLKRIVSSERENGIGGFIVRTAAANIKEEDLRADIRFLKHLWAEIKNRAENSKSPALIYHDLNLVERVLRDQVNADFSQIWVDTEEEFERVVRFANRFQPSLVRRIKLYTKDVPLFEQFGIQDEIDRSLKSKVWLKSGGYIVINQTEALVAIDINTGKYVGKTQRLEDTIVKTNVDAIKEIVRQIRLRDLGGIIVIDFIDMDERKNRQKVMQALEEALRADRAPSKVLQFNDFGLVAITRKRVKQSLERTLGDPCPYCTGAGFVKSVTTVCNELYTEMRKMVKRHDRNDITVRVNPEVAKELKANNGRLIAEMEELTGKTVLVKSDPLLHQETFDIQ